MPLLTIRDLDVRFPGLGRPALFLPALTLEAGQALVVTGPSGSGKTTFLNRITGLEASAAGAITWQGTDLGALSEGARDRWRARTIGLVMQEFHLFPGLSALENVVLPQRLAHFRLPPAVLAEAEGLLARVGIERPDQRIETLSRGQMQRVAVARALVGRPGVIVADEPTASLDDEAGTAVADLLVNLAKDAGASLIVASHDPVFFARIPRLLRLEAGRQRA
ncbi:ABC transporter ATP-binding protein [Rhodospirillum rubrum]|uniref:ABC transporter component n=1 Tax=Rhodospirillum rubrum (strain ATCC 11170 / ATH 1.1.1 / DSM 467 / LMG 4362 / NCIMB 8255 / S1) TaxID=269796 RepID=Q2RUV3_RHORT|nr:ATP-binding cassette domain-containing protein [Rhodospirillum rubrum]ABC22092.1 ABC transporter component [Rhodospirillum rubrum ATCC 11170]AEO47806.1 ABC transporter protein [Rhodospirillum rubrum F11]MBK5953682.1 ABC transporter [Rhodospirillum rubrum]QXG81745.1 ATP-binding cassette domain-containing protein [Rhodospirillum rubrum]HAQ00346.1 ABC transporter [Rhodospirillum rubrum]